MVRSVDQAVELVRTICHLIDNGFYLTETPFKAATREMIKSRDTAALYGRLMHEFSYQGIADRIADSYIARHGNARWDDVRHAIETHHCGCPKLAGFEAYVGCRYRKGAATCANRADLPNCPVPTLPLRKGDLNQLAFSLFFFLRDCCRGDLVGFIDALFAETDATQPADPAAAKREALIAALSKVHAVSTKLIAMAFAGILMAADPTRADWIAVGQSMVAVDSLVHNFLHRTGILEVFGLNHPYGPGCYGKKGCSVVLYDLAGRIDVSTINPTYPGYFPRLVQGAIWSFCAEGNFDICNGRQIDDRLPCLRTDCPVGYLCSRIALRSAKEL